MISNEESERMKEEERSSVMDSAKSVLFNLNTIESIMLVSTIMVNLAGIMLLSGQFENLDPEDEFQRDIITYTIIVVISGSFSILFLSLVREIRLARRLSKNMARARWRAIIRKQIAVNKKKFAALKRFQNVVHDVMRREKVGKANHDSYLQPQKAPAKKPNFASTLARKHSRKSANVGVKPIPEVEDDVEKLDWLADNADDYLSDMMNGEGEGAAAKEDDSRGVAGVESTGVKVVDLY